MGSRYSNPIDSTSIIRQCKEVIALKPLAERLLGITINGDRFDGAYLGSQGKNSCVIYNKSKKGYPIIKDFGTGKAYDAYSLLTDIAGLSPKDAVNELKRLAGIGEDVTSKLSIKQLSIIKRKQEQQRAKLANEAAKEQQQKTAYVNAEIAKAYKLPTTGSSGYLKAKGATAPTCQHLRYDSNNNAHVILYHIQEDKKLKPVGIQRLLNKPNTQGKNKIFVWGSATSGAFNLIGCEDIAEIDKPWQKVFIVEGYATGLTVHNATSQPVIVALNAGNLDKVTKAIKKQCSKLKDIVIVPDNDQYKPIVGNVGLEKAHKAAFENRVTVAPTPQFKDTTSKPTDYNDLEQLEGLAEVQRQLLATSPTIDISLVFKEHIEKSNRQIQEMVSSGRATLGTKEYPYMPDIPLGKGTIVCHSPHGSGKNHQAEKLVLKAIKEHKRLMIITDRQTLANESAKRLGIESYSDIEGSDIRLASHLSCCLNSLPRLLSDNPQHYHSVIIDETEQLTTSLIENYIDNKPLVLKALEHFVGEAEDVLCLDADAGLLTKQFLKEYRPNETPKWIRHHYPVGQGRLVNLYEYKGDLYNKALSYKEPMFFVTNNKKEAEQLDHALKMQGKKGKLITSDTSEKEREFLTDIEKNSIKLELDYVICSPSISTGISMDIGYFKHVVGCFTSFVSTAEKALQALWRNRKLATYDVYVDTTAENFGINDKVAIDFEYDKRIAQEASKRPNELHLSHNEKYNRIVELVKRQERVKRTEYRNNLIKLMLSQGFEFEYHPTQYTNQEINGKKTRIETHKQLLETIEYSYEQSRLNGIADRENADYDKARGSIVELFKIEEHENIKPFAIVDEKGKYKTRFNNSACVRSSNFLDNHEKKLARDNGMDINMPAIRTQTEFYKKLSYFVGVDEAEGKIKQAGFNAAKESLQAILDNNEAGSKLSKRQIKLNYFSDNLRQLQNSLPRYNKETIAPFIEWVIENYESIARGVNLPPIEKLRENPMCYVGGWLKQIGLRQRIVGYKGSKAPDRALDVIPLAVRYQTTERHGLIPQDATCEDLPSQQPVPPVIAPPLPPVSHDNVPQDEARTIKNIGDVLNLMQKRLNDGFFDSLPSIDDLRTYLARAHNGNKEAATAIMEYYKQLINQGMLKELTV